MAGVMKRLLLETMLAATAVQHVYGGGWAHFVGSGVAVFDCDSNGYPDYFDAKGKTRRLGRGPF